jgi:hypothetical protein
MPEGEIRAALPKLLAAEEAGNDGPKVRKSGAVRKEGAENRRPAGAIRLAPAVGVRDYLQ